MKLPAVVLADIHAQKSNLEEVVYLFKIIRDVGDRHSCKSMVIVGDLFNSSSKIDTEVYTTVYTELKKCSGNIPDIRIVAGNHDMLSYTTNISPLIPFQDICTVYTEYAREGKFEFVPYHTSMEREYATDPGVTFIHYTLKEILDAINIPYTMNHLAGIVSPNRTYLVGHVHIPIIRDNVISLGTPVQYMFDPEKETSHNIYFLSENCMVHQIPLYITTYNTIEVNSPDDLINANINYGHVSTYVKLKIRTDNITPSDILAFKNKVNCTVVLDKVANTSRTNTLANTQSTKTLDIYRDFIKKASTSLDKRELYSTVVEELKDADIL